VYICLHLVAILGSVFEMMFHAYHTVGRLFCVGRGKKGAGAERKRGE
jgi:hypothetical protein